MGGLRRIGLITIIIGSCTGSMDPIPPDPEPYVCVPYAERTISRTWPDSLTLVMGSADDVGIERAVEDGCSYASLEIPDLTIAVRDSAVATVTQDGSRALVASGTPGSSWIVFEGTDVLDSIYVAVPDTFMLGTVEALAAGGDLTCAMEDDGRVMCWGGDYYGILGDYGDPYIGTCFGQPCSPMPKPIGLQATDAFMNADEACVVSAAGTTCRRGGMDEFWTAPVFREVSMGGGHRCGVTSSGEGYCWGGNYQGQLGTGVYGDYQEQPQRIPAPDTWSAIDVQWDSTCGIAGGGLYCWGVLPEQIPAPRQCEVSPGGKSSGPVYAPCSATPVRISAGTHLGSDTILVDIAGRCFLTSAGGVLCLAGAELRRAAGPGTFATLEAGGDHDCGLSVGGEALCWGENYAGQLGTGDFSFAGNPVAVAGGHRFTDLALGAMHTCGLTDGGEVLCWGEPITGQTGVSITTNNITVPTRIRGQGAP